MCFPGERHWEGGRQRKKNNSISVYHAWCSRLWLQPLAGATMTMYSQRACRTQAAPPAETPHSSVHPSCSQSQHNWTLSTCMAQSHRGFEPTWGRWAPAPGIPVGRVMPPKPQCQQQSQHCPSAQLLLGEPSLQLESSTTKASLGQGATAGTFTSLFFPSWASCKWSTSLGSCWLCPALA